MNKIISVIACVKYQPTHCSIALHSFSKLGHNQELSGLAPKPQCTLVPDQ